ncbi:MAG: tetratricopeptide repeat protein [Nitrospirales bacterium]
MRFMSQLGIHQHRFRFLRNVVPIIITLALLFFGYPFLVWAQGQLIDSEETVVTQATEAWIEGSPLEALDIVEEGLRDYSHSLPLRKLRGDIRTTIRQNQDAVRDYEAILQETPEALAVRWAKWSTLTRMGRADLAINELQRIAQGVATNPLIHLRLAQELRKLDRLEESVKEYQKAVDLAPGMAGWRLSLARALFDVLHYDDARKEVEKVLKTVPPDSPVEMAARNLLMITYGATKERGRRYQPIFSPEGSAEDRKRWALIRHEGWEHFAKGRYQKAEPILRELLALKPTDHLVTYELGCTLMELGQHEEAVALLQQGIELGPTSGSYSEIFLDSIYRIGQSLVALERWEEALLHFEILEEIATVPPEILNAAPLAANEPQTLDPGSGENIDAPPPTISGKVIDQEKLAFWLDKIWQHIPKPEKPIKDANETLPAADVAAVPSDYYTNLAAKKFKPDALFHTRASLMGRDADFSWFRFVIPAGRVMRDNLEAGNHEFIPIDPSDIFPHTQQEIYLVFALVTPSYDAIPLTAECYREASPITWGETSLFQDQVIMSTNEQSGYFVLIPPKSGWTPGLYRCGLFVGDTVSAYTQSDEVRFRIMRADQSN